jgi:hypothetical protein
MYRRTLCKRGRIAGLERVVVDDESAGVDNDDGASEAAVEARQRAGSALLGGSPGGLRGDDLEGGRGEGENGEEELQHFGSRSYMILCDGAAQQVLIFS